MGVQPKPASEPDYPQTEHQCTGLSCVHAPKRTQEDNQGGTALGKPDRVEHLGETQIPYSVFLDYLLSLGETKYKSGTWNLVKHNCNSFTDEVSQFICGSGVPKYILDLPDQILNTPIEEEIRPVLDQLCVKKTGGIFLGTARSSATSNYTSLKVNRELSPEFEELQAQIDALRADQRSLEERRNATNIKEVKKEKKKKSKDKEHKEGKTEKKHKKRGSLGECLEESSKEEKKKEKKNKLHLDRSRSAGGLGENNHLTPPQSDEEPFIQLHSPNREAAEAPTNQEQEVSEDTSDILSCDTESVNKQTDICDTKAVEDIPTEQTNSILVETPSPPAREKKKKSLVRDKSLKRVSFEEKPAIIGEDVAEPITTLEAIADDKQEEVDEVVDSVDVVDSDLPPLEEVDTNEARVRFARRSPPPAVIMAEAEQIEIPTEGGEAELIPRKEKKPHVPGITFRDFEQVKDFEDLVRTIVTLCSQEEQERLREMEDWIIKNEGTWVLAEGFNSFLGRVLHSKDLPSEARVAMLRLLAFGAGQDDIVLILHMDRKDHLIMNYAQDFDRLPIMEQESLALLFCNLFETGSASEWLLYISEWDSPGGGLPLSNIRVTTKVAVNALLGDTPTLVDYGSALMSNLSTKEVFDDVCSELAMAILQFYQGKPPEEQVFRTMAALNKFCSIAHRDVPQLVKMIGPEPSKFSGMSPRIDEHIEAVQARLAKVPMF